MGKYNSITRTGANEPFDLHVQRGFIEGHFTVQKFGFATSVSGTEVPVWDGGSLYTYATSAGPITMAATSGTNTTSRILIQGLDADYNLQEETLTLNATTTVTSANNYLRIFRTQTVNDVNVAEQVNFYLDGNRNGVIEPNENQSLMALYTIPAGYTGFLNQINISSGTAQPNQFIRVRVKEREFGGVFQTKAKYTVSNSFVEERYTYPLVIPEKADLQITAISSSNINEIATIFNLLLIKNNTNDDIPTRSGATQ